jgi:hypothetical protein
MEDNGCMELHDGLVHLRVRDRAPGRKSRKYKSREFKVDYDSDMSECANVEATKLYLNTAGVEHEGTERRRRVRGCDMRRHKFSAILYYFDQMFRWRMTEGRELTARFFAPNRLKKAKISGPSIYGNFLMIAEEWTPGPGRNSWNPCPPGFFRGNSTPHSFCESYPDLQDIGRVLSDKSDIPCGSVLLLSIFASLSGCSLADLHGLLPAVCKSNDTPIIL